MREHGADLEKNVVARLESVGEDRLPLVLGQELSLVEVRASQAPQDLLIIGGICVRLLQQLEHLLASTRLESMARGQGGLGHLIELLLGVELVGRGNVVGVHGSGGLRSPDGVELNVHSPLVRPIMER